MLSIPVKTFVSHGGGQSLGGDIGEAFRNSRFWIDLSVHNGTVSYCCEVNMPTKLIVQYGDNIANLLRGTAMSMGSMSARIGSIIMPFTLELQKSIPWLTQVCYDGLCNSSFF